MLINNHLYTNVKDNEITTLQSKYNIFDFETNKDNTTAYIDCLLTLPKEEYEEALENHTLVELINKYSFPSWLIKDYEYEVSEDHKDIIVLGIHIEFDISI